MIKEFGVKIYFGYNSEDSVYLELKDFDCFGTFSEVFDEVNDTGRLYVAKQSEKIFVPLYIDVGRGEDEDFYTLMRGDKHFFQPKIEKND